MAHDHEDEDKTIVEALSSLGWVEEKEEENNELEDPDALKEQLELFKKQNAELNEKISDLKLNDEALQKRNEKLMEEKNELQMEVENCKSQLEDVKFGAMGATEIDSEDFNNLKEQIEDKEAEIMDLKDVIKDFDLQVEELNSKITDHFT